MVTAINQGMFTNQPSTPSSGFVFAVGNQVFNTIEEAKRYLAQNPRAGTISRVPFQTTTSGMLDVVTTPVIRAPATPPKTPPKQMPGDSGPIIANPGGTTIPIPAPAPAPAPQTGPIGIPSSDPTKRSAGDTGPIIANPGGGTLPTSPPTQTAPAPAPEPEAELAPPKPLPDTKEPAPEPEGITTFTFFRGDETGDANPDALYNRSESTQLTQADLKEYFDADSSGMLQRAFGNFNNYLAYMTEREQLIQAGDYDVGDWNEFTGELTEDELMILEGEDLTQFGDDAQSDYTELYRERTQEQSSAYNRWVNSEENQALLEKYGIGATVYNSDGDTFRWNGSAYVKTDKVDQVGLTEYVKAGLDIALSFLGPAATGAFANFLAEQGALGNLGETMQIITQVFDRFEQSGYSVGQAASVLNDSTVIMNIAEAANELEEGEQSTAEQINNIASGAIQILRDIEPEPDTPLEEPEFEIDLPEPTQEEPEPDLPIEIEPPTLPEDGIFTDTTQEATGLEASVIQDLFSDFMEEFRSEFEGQQGITIEQVQEVVANELGSIEQPENLTEEQVQQIVNNAVASIPQADTLSEEQVQQIVSNAVSAIEIPEGITTEEVQGIVDTAIAGINIPEGISEEQVGNIVDTAIANIEFPEGVTQEQVNQIVNQAIGDIQFPEGVTQSQVTEIVNQAIAGIEFPEIDTLSTDEVQSIVNTAISGIEFPEGVTSDQVLNIIQAQLEAQPEGLTSDDVNQIVSTAISNIQFPASVTQEEVTDLLGEVEDTLSSSLESYQEGVQEELALAEEERAVLGGQLGTLTSDVAQVAEDLIRADGRIEELDEASRERFDELGLSIEDLSLRVGVNLEALQTGMLTQDAALRELIEESTTQTEESLTQRLEQAEEGFATSLSDTEANLLSQITGVEAGVLQQLATVEGGLQSQFGEQFGQVQEQVAGLGEQVSGIGEQVAGVGEGLGQLGQAIGTGLLGLAAAQPTAQQIASAMPRQPVKFDPFLKGLSPFQPLTPLTLRPIQEKDAVSELNKFIGRQTGMLV